MVGSAQNEQRMLLDGWSGLLPFFSVVVVVALWQIIGSSVPYYIFPNIPELYDAYVMIFTGGTVYEPMEHIPITLARIAITFLIVMPIGMAIGISMGMNGFLETYISPYVLISLAFPSIVWAFLAAIWFGITTYLVPVFVGVLICIPFVIINAWEGTKDIDQNLLEMAESFDADTLLVWRFVFIPHLTPYTFATMRIVLSVAWKIMLVAEIFGTQSGIGFIINEYFLQQRNDIIIAWTLPVMMMVFVFERVLKRLEEAQFEWRPDAGPDAQMGAG